MARHELWLCNDYGTRIADLWGHTMLDRVQSFTATRVANDIGTFTANVPATFDPTLLRRDMIVQVMRSPDGGAMELFRHYFLRRWIYETKRGKLGLELHGVCCNDLLRRRVITSAPGTMVSTKGGVAGIGETADDIMKAIVSECLIDATGGYGWPVPLYGTRDWPLFSVEADAGAGPFIDPIDVSYEYLLQPNQRGALYQVIDEARQEGVDLYFDVVPLVLTGNQLSFVFRVRLGQPGQDITTSGVLFSQDRGNLTDCSLSYDYTAEENYIYGVKEQGPYDTKVTQRWSVPGVAASIWNRIEGTVDKTSRSTGNYLRDKRGRLRFTGRITDTPGMRYGVDWSWGDRVRVRYLQFQFNAVIKAVTLSVDRNGQEQIGTRLEYETNA